MTSPSQSSPSHLNPSRIAAIAGSVDRSRSVSSIRSSILPPCFLAKSQLNSAVRAPPMWRKPVGEGAKRVTMESVITGGSYAERSGGVYQEPCITKASEEAKWAWRAPANLAERPPDNQEL